MHNVSYSEVELWVIQTVLNLKTWELSKFTSYLKLVCPRAFTTTQTQAFEIKILFYIVDIFRLKLFSPTLKQPVSEWRKIVERWAVEVISFVKQLIIQTNAYIYIFHHRVIECQISCKIYEFAIKRNLLRSA